MARKKLSFDVIDWNDFKNSYNDENDIQDDDNKKSSNRNKFTKMAIEMIKDAYLMWANDTQAALLAWISLNTLSRWKKEHPAFKAYCDLMKDDMVLKAKATVKKYVDKWDLKTAQWFLERRAKEEFSTKQEVDNNLDWEIIVSWAK